MTFHLADLHLVQISEENNYLATRASHVALLAPSWRKRICSMLLLLNNAAASGCSARTLDAASYTGTRSRESVSSFASRRAQGGVHSSGEKGSERREPRNIWRTAFRRVSLPLPFAPFFRAALPFPTDVPYARRRTLT